MLFDYIDALTGQDIYIESIGHFFSPKLKQITSANMGKDRYYFYLSLLSWNKKEVLKYLQILNVANTKILSNDKLTIFDIITLIPQLREDYFQAFSFFIRESIQWDEKSHRYTLHDPENEDIVVGYINRENYDIVRKIILQLNYKEMEDEESKTPKFASEAARIAWERCQEFEEKAVTIDKPQYHISNIVSKLCVIHPSYNLLNVTELTMFQIYDAFFQCSFMRGTELGEAIFSNHGGDKFNYEDWLKPISKQI